MTAKVEAPRKRRTRWGRLLLFAAAAYVGVCIVLLCLENVFLYHPVRADQDWERPPTELAVQDVWLQAYDGTRIHAWWCPYPGAQGAVLYCHGNAGNLSYRGEALLQLRAALHQSILIFDYPGFGRSGGKPSEAGCHAAAEAAYD